MGKNHGLNHVKKKSYPHHCEIDQGREVMRALKLVAERHIIVIIGRWRRGLLRRCGSSRDGGSGDAAWRGRWYLHLTGHAQHLANVDIRALGVDLGVVQVKDGVVDAMTRGNLVACIVENNYVGRGAVFASVTKTESAAW